MDLLERARRYVGKMSPAISGQGGHNSTFAVATALVKGFDLSIDQARSILSEYNQRCEPPWSVAELEHKLVSADGTPDDKPRGWLIGENIKALAREKTVAQEVTPPVEKPIFESEKLKAFAAQWRPFVSTAWLADRSAADPFDASPEDFLTTLYEPGELVLIFTSQVSQGDAVWPRDKLPHGGADGVWFLIQPIDGKVYPNPRSLDKAGKPKFSRRSEESVTSWRYLVLESDRADPRDWLGAIVRMSLPIAAIYTSGKRSIHVLLRLDADSLADWRDFSKSVLRPIFSRLGADDQVVATPVRLSRLPGCLRGSSLQKLLYLNRLPEAKPLCTLPRLRDCVGTWISRAEKFLPTRACDVIEKAKPKNLNETITALEVDEKKRIGPSHSLGECLRALDWFSTSPQARALLEKLKSHGRRNEEEQTRSDQASA